MQAYNLYQQFTRFYLHSKYVEVNKFSSIRKDYVIYYYMNNISLQGLNDTTQNNVYQNKYTWRLQICCILGTDDKSLEQIVSNFELL